MPRPFVAGLVIALAISGLLLYFLTGADPVTGPTGGGEDTTSARSTPDFGEGGTSGSTAKKSGTSTATEEPPPPEPTTPPMLSGTVLGEGTGVGGAQVMLFSAKRVEDLMLRAEAEVTQMAAGGMPDFAAILDWVRGELTAFRKSAIIARTDPDGHFEVRDVPGGGYFLLTTAPRWLFRYGDVVSLAEETTTTITLPLERGASIAGRVVDPNGGGRGGVRVIAEFAPPSTTGIGPLVRRGLAYVNGEFLKGPFETVSADDGSFTISSLPMGTYNITAYTKNDVESTVQGIETGTTGVIVYFGQPASVIGTLVTPNGFPIPDVPMQLERIDQVINIPFPGANDMIAMAEDLLGIEPREATTDANGAFRFPELGAGRYRLVIESPGLNPYTSEFRVEWGEIHDLADIRVDLGSRISGRVISSVTGGGLPGVRVSAGLEAGGMMNMGGVMRDVMSGRLVGVTDEDGNFEIGGLRPASNYGVIAGLEGYAPDSAQVVSDGPPVELVLNPGERITGMVLDAVTGAGIGGATVRSGTTRTETDPSGAFTLEGVVAGDRNIDFMFGPRGRFSDEQETSRSARVSARAPGKVEEQVTVDMDREADGVVIELRTVTPIRGTVYDPSGGPRPGALVRLTPDIPDDIPFAIDTSLIFFGVTVADEDGKYAFEKYFAPPEGRMVVIADFPGTTRGRSESFDLEELDGVTPYDIQLRVASTITGVVTDGSGPVPGAIVRLQKGAAVGNPREMMFMQMLGLPKGGEVVHTDGEGRFEFEALTAGDFRINAEMVGYTDSPEQPVSLAEGQTLDLTLVVDPGAVLTGTVTDDRGAAIEGAFVRVIEETGVEEEMIEAQLFLGGALRSARTDASGRYEIVGLNPGGYTVVAEKRGHAKGVESGLYVHDVTTQHLTLLPAAGLVGQVVDKATGDPIQDFDLMFAPRSTEMRIGGGREPISSVEGVFERDDLDPGTYDVSIRAAGFSGSNFEVDLQPGLVHEERVELERAGRIEGVVLDQQTGAPVRNARVKIELPAVDGEDPASMQSIVRDLAGSESDTTGEDGTFALDSVPPGVSTLVVTHDQYVVLRQPSPAVFSGQLATVELRLSPGHSVTGTLRRANGTPAEFTYVVLVGDDEATTGVRKGVVTEEDGSFRFEGLENGQYRLRSGYRDEDSGQVTVTVDGNVSGVELQLGSAP